MMPCRDRETPQEHRPCQDVGRLKAKCDELTRMLCGVLIQVDAVTLAASELGCAIDLDDATRAWWVAHKRRDAEWKAAARESARAKLTTEEREALGL